MSRHKRYGENSKQIALKLDGEMHDGLLAMQANLARQDIFVEVSSLIRSAIAKYLKTRIVFSERPSDPNPPTDQDKVG